MQLFKIPMQMCCCWPQWLHIKMASEFNHMSPVTQNI